MRTTNENVFNSLTLEINVLDQEPNANDHTASSTLWSLIKELLEKLKPATIIFIQQQHGENERKKERENLDQEQERTS